MAPTNDYACTSCLPARHTWHWPLLARFDRRGSTVLEMVSHEFSSDGAQCFMCRGYLRHYIRAIAFFLNHFLDSTDLPLDPAQPLEITLLRVAVDADCLPWFARSPSSRCHCSAASVCVVRIFVHVVPVMRRT